MRAGVLAWGLALAVGAVAAGASAQDREHVLGSVRLDAWEAADLSWYAPAQGSTTVRVLVRGSMTCALDGAEIDAMRITTTSRVLDAATPVVFPPGARFVEQRGAHAYVFELATDESATIALNVPGLASRYLVTASELRDSLTGAIFVDVLGPPPSPGVAAAAPASAEIPSENSDLTGVALAGSALGLPLLAFGLFFATRRRRTREDRLMTRVRRARAE
ncbi:MAG: hypothetical protein M3Y87_26490, partial [Myxococcota bacterium]|nr:hypothetical protein [Myxococcota bacterium]